MPFAPRLTVYGATFTVADMPSLEAIWTSQYQEFGPPNVMFPEAGSGFEPCGYSIVGALLSVWAMFEAVRRGNRRAQIMLVIMVVLWVI